MRCRAIRSRPFPITRRAKGFILGRPAIPIHIPRSASPRWPGYSPSRRRWRNTRSRARSNFSASQPKSLRLKAGACRQRLFRQLRCLRHLSSEGVQHGHARCAFRCLLERRLHVRDRESGNLDRPQPVAAQYSPARHRTMPRRDRCAMPDVHHDQIHQGGDVSAFRFVDPQRVHSRGRRRDLGQSAPALQPDPIFVAVIGARHPAADLQRARAQCAPCRRDDRLSCVGALGDEDAGRPRQRHFGRRRVRKPQAGRADEVQRGRAKFRPRDSEEPRHCADG